jgi:predicted regulator of amino acid metabolism with ACT domain
MPSAKGWIKGEIMKKFQEMNESEKVVELTTKLGLSVKEAELAVKNGKKTTVELTESHTDLPFLTEAQNAKRAKIEKQIQENASKPRLLEAYKALGLTEAEAKIAAHVEERIITLNDLDFTK